MSLPFQASCLEVATGGWSELTASLPFVNLSVWRASERARNGSHHLIPDASGVGSFCLPLQGVARGQDCPTHPCLAEKGSHAASRGLVLPFRLGGPDPGTMTSRNHLDRRANRWERQGAWAPSSEGTPRPGFWMWGVSTGLGASAELCLPCPTPVNKATQGPAADSRRLLRQEARKSGGGRQVPVQSNFCNTVSGCLFQSFLIIFTTN